MSLALLDMSRKDIFGGGEGSLGVPRLGFGVRALGARGGSGIRGGKGEKVYDLFFLSLQWGCVN